MNRIPSRSRRVQRAGQSMLELVAASMLIGTTLVPALQIMTRSLEVTRKLTTSEALATLGASMLEKSLAQTSSTWSTASSSGNFSSDGYPTIGYTVTRSDAVTDGGIPNSLMAIQVTTWDDRNNNGRWDTGEPTVTFASKVARLTTYDYEARIS